PGARVALLPPRPRRHGVQPARRQPGLPPVPRVQVSPQIKSTHCISFFFFFFFFCHGLRSLAFLLRPCSYCLGISIVAWLYATAQVLRDAHRLGSGRDLIGTRKASALVDFAG